MIAIPFDIPWGYWHPRGQPFHLARENVARPGAAGGMSASLRGGRIIISIAPCSPAVGLSCANRLHLGQHLRSRPLHQPAAPRVGRTMPSKFFLFGGIFSPYAPRDHVFAVRAPPSSDPPLSEMGLCPIVGIFTVGDASFTTWVQIHSGSTAITTFPCVASLNTDSPQTSNEGAQRQLQTTSADSLLFDRISVPRSLGGFRTSALLRTQGSKNLSWFNRAPWSRSLCARSPRLGDCVSSRLCGLHWRLASAKCSRSTLFAVSGLLLSSTTTWSRCFHTMDILHTQFHHRLANGSHCRDRRLRPRDLLGTALTSLLHVPVDVIYIG